MYSHLLVPTDHSPLSVEAAREAVSCASALGARVTFFHALPLPTVLNYVSEAAPDIDTNPSLMSTTEIRETMEAICRQHLEELSGIAQEARVDCATDSVVNPHPHRAIIEAAERHGCDLVFMASHGHRGLQALLLGSETQKVLTHCSLPVLVWRRAKHGEQQERRD